MAQLNQSKTWGVKGSLVSDFFYDDQFYNSPWLSGMRLPALNVKDTGNAYEIELTAPGFNKNDFRISIDQGLLTVSGKSMHENEDGSKEKESAYTSFSRSFSLPLNTAEKDVMAKFDEGILRLSITKTVFPQSEKKIDIVIK